MNALLAPTAHRRLWAHEASAKACRHWWAELDSNQRGFLDGFTVRCLQPLGHPPIFTLLLPLTSAVLFTWCSTRDSNPLHRVTNPVHRHQCLQSHVVASSLFWWAGLDSNQRGFLDGFTVRCLQPLGHPPISYSSVASFVCPLFWCSARDSNPLHRVTNPVHRHQCLQSYVLACFFSI